MRIKINGRYYRLKDSVVIRCQGIMLLCLAYLSYTVEAYEAFVIFLFMGGLMTCPYIGKINRCLYWVAKKIVRQGHRREY